MRPSSTLGSPGLGSCMDSMGSVLRGTIMSRSSQRSLAWVFPCSGVKLFRRAAKQATFSAETVNRRVKHIPAAPAAIVAHPWRLHANAISDSEVTTVIRNLVLRLPVHHA